MTTIKVLGSGCKKCQNTAEAIEGVIRKKGIDADVIKETSAEAIMQYKVMKTPAVVIDEVVVHSGSVPTPAEIESWL